MTRQSPDSTLMLFPYPPFRPSRARYFSLPRQRKSTQKKGDPKAGSLRDCPALLAPNGRSQNSRLRRSNTCSLSPLCAAMLGCAYGTERENRSAIARIVIARSLIIPSLRGAQRRGNLPINNPRPREEQRHGNLPRPLSLRERARVRESNHQPFNRFCPSNMSRTKPTTSSHTTLTFSLVGCDGRLGSDKHQIRRRATGYCEGNHHVDTSCPSGGHLACGRNFAK